MARSDSDPSCATVSIKKRTKSSKKSNRKSHKKQKKEKRTNQKKRPKKDIDSYCSSSSEDIVSSQKLISAKDLRESTDCFGPALPPHLLSATGSVQAPILIGPKIPDDCNINTSESSLQPIENVSTEPKLSHDEEADIMSTYGPFPQTSDGCAKPVSDAQLQLEERALQLKLASIDVIINKEVDQKVREEWMLELPEIGLKGGLAALSNMKRKFHHGKERPDFSDRSAWTKTPQSIVSVNEVNSGVGKAEATTLVSEAQALYDRQRDEEQERIARKHKKKHKRDESLVELHQKKIRKQQKEKEKEMDTAGAKPERRPFSRDVDLKLNKIDKNQTKSIVDKAKVLNTKFATGHVKYL